MTVDPGFARAAAGKGSGRPVVVTFGEIMLRLSPPGLERLFQSPLLSATFGGGEANVAVSLAHLGLESVYVTRLPANAVGDAALRCLRAEGVRTEHVIRGGDRLGIYFAESGASQRPSTVIYDRVHSAVAGLTTGMIDWRGVLQGADWLHVTGITPALGPAVAAATAEALAAAKEARVTVSVDLNFRRKLWSEADARATMRPLVQHARLLVANEEDLQAALGVEVSGVDVLTGALAADAYRDACTRVARELGVGMVAITLRESRSASDNGWSAVLWDAERLQFHQSRHYDVRVVDRIGGGDAFAAGLIFALLDGREPGAALEFATAAGALKHTIPGDFNRVSVGEVDRLVQGDASGRVQR
jgi:2-dehydro-3-deoxygluconokinase